MACAPRSDTSTARIAPPATPASTPWRFRATSGPTSSSRSRLWTDDGPMRRWFAEFLIVALLVAGVSAQQTPARPQGATPAQESKEPVTAAQVAAAIDK